MASTTFQKREKETKRLDKARQKQQRREERKTEKKTRDPGPGGGIDPDIADIVPGPQPIPEDY